ncbi:alpha-L-fucosidase [Photobacterium swingsii]|uniref:alpha-L-fucosidase n=1 Tax=Photobacterium swingsii TaxID=680026 RepID=UPI003D09D685
MGEISIPQSIANSVDDFQGEGDQFLSLERLQQFQALRFGMFLHWGMSTFDGKELSSCEPLETYQPLNIDVDQWIRVAAETGMQYAVLTVKHVSGHALWPSNYGEYSVKNSAVTTDVVAEFVAACKKYQIKPCFYYCAWDNTNLFGMKPTPDWATYSKGIIHTNDAYREFMWAQINELLTLYGPIEMLWVDIPHVLPLDKKKELYAMVKSIDPNVIFAFNHSCQDGTQIDSTTFFPTDIMTMERTLPNHAAGHAKQSYYQWKEVDGGMYYIPGEYNDTIGREWFYQEYDEPRDDLDLLAIVLGSTSRGVNCLLNVPPNKEGVLPEKWVSSLKRLRENLDKVGFFNQ